MKAKGVEYFYFALNWRDKSFKRIPMKTTPDQSEFWTLYDTLVAEHGLSNDTIKEVAVSAGTIAAITADYLKSPSFAKNSARTQKHYRQITAAINAKLGAEHAKNIKRSDIIKIQDDGSDRPAATNNFLKVLSVLFSHSIYRSIGGVEFNPCSKIKKLEVGEIEPWPWAAVMFARMHMRPYMWRAVALAVYTGQRQSDCLRMAWPDVGSGCIGVVTSTAPELDNEDDDGPQMSASDALRLICAETGVAPDLADFRQRKTNKRLWIPIHQELQQVLEGIERRAPTILCNQSGLSWTTDGFKTMWRAEMKRPAVAPLKALGVKFHGLRKTATIKLIEAGCSDAEVVSITGHSRQMLEHYSKRVDQEREAKKAIKKWERVA